MASGVATTVTDTAYVDGPLSDGTEVSLIVHAQASAAAATAAVRVMAVMDLCIPKVRKVDLNAGDDAHRVAGPVRAVERHFGDRGENRAVVHELHERRFLFRRVPHELESDRDRTGRGHGAGDAAVNRI